MTLPPAPDLRRGQERAAAMTSFCPACHAASDASHAREGDITFCWSCAALLIYGPCGELRRPEAALVAELDADPRWPHLAAAMKRVPPRLPSARDARITASRRNLIC